jgi:hypothetical protein
MLVHCVGDIIVVVVTVAIVVVVLSCVRPFRQR